MQSPTLTGSGNSHVLSIGRLSLLFSYQTCAAFEYKGRGYRRADLGTSSTAKHIVQFGGRNFEKLDEKLFTDTLSIVIAQAAEDL